MNYDSRQDTIAHIKRVRELLAICRERLRVRGLFHDSSKLSDPEKALFDEYTPKLAGVTYGSDEYKQCLKELNPALEHHYANNDHHPEHQASMPDGTIDHEYVENGWAVGDMNLFQIMEMLMDWKAASERHNNGNIYTSIDLNSIRFGLSDQLTTILHNTAYEMDW